MKRIKFIFAWYDLWLGMYWDKKKRRLYFMIPFVGFFIRFKFKCETCYRNVYYEALDDLETECSNCYEEQAQAYLRMETNEREYDNHILGKLYTHYSDKK